jgi:hypothetical protein
MSDIRAPFPSLEDGSLVAAVLRAIQAGDSTAAKNGSLGFAFRDVNAVLPQLDAEGKLPVTSDSAGTILRARGTNTDQNSSAADVAGASIALTASKTYVNIGMHVSCRRAALFQLIQVNDVTETVLADVILDAGQYSHQFVLAVDQIIAGASGTQTLKVKAQTFDKASNVYASLSCKEVS